MMGTAALFGLLCAGAFATDPEPAPGGTFDAPVGAAGLGLDADGSTEHTGGMGASGVGGVPTTLGAGATVGASPGGAVGYGGLTRDPTEAARVGDRWLFVETQPLPPHASDEEVMSSEYIDRMSAMDAALREARAGIRSCWVGARVPFDGATYEGRVTARDGRLLVAGLKATATARPAIEACIREGVQAVPVAATLTGTVDARFDLFCRLGADSDEGCVAR